MRRERHARLHHVTAAFTNGNGRHRPPGARDGWRKREGGGDLQITWAHFWCRHVAALGEPSRSRSKTRIGVGVFKVRELGRVVLRTSWLKPCTALCWEVRPFVVEPVVFSFRRCVAGFHGTKERLGCTESRCACLIQVSGTGCASKVLGGFPGKAPPEVSQLLTSLLTKTGNGVGGGSGCSEGGSGCSEGGSGSSGWSNRVHSGVNRWPQKIHAGCA